MKYSTVVMDLDGTLLNSQHRLTPPNLRMLKELDKRGVHILIASGRMTPSILKLFGNDFVPKNVISYNGAKLSRRQDEGYETLHHFSLDVKTICQIIDISIRLNLFLNIYKDDKIFGFHPQGNFGESEFYQKQTRIHYESYFSNRDEIPLEDITKLLYIPGTDKRDQLYEIIINIEELNCSILKSQPEFIEFILKGIDKSTALRSWSEFNGVALDSILGFGDAENDLAMLNVCGRGIAMANATKGLKKEFPHLSSWSNEEHGVYREVNAIFGLGLPEPEERES